MKTSLSRNMTALLLVFAAAHYSPPRQAAAQTTPAAKWERYTFPGDEFSVELPAMPFVFHTRPSETLDVLAGRHAGDSHTATAREVAAGGYKGKEYRRTADTPAGLPLLTNEGAGQRGAGTTPRAAASRIFRTDKRVYLVRTLSPADGHPWAERFFDSLTLSDRPRGLKIDERDPPALRPPTADDDPNRVFRHNEVTRKAVIVYKPDPGFTEEARRNNVRGVVRLRAVLTATGRVTSVSVVKGLPDGLTERSIYAARHILFPAQMNGRDVSQQVMLEYRFNVD